MIEFLPLKQTLFHDNPRQVALTRNSNPIVALRKGTIAVFNFKENEAEVEDKGSELTFGDKAELQLYSLFHSKMESMTFVVSELDHNGNWFIACGAADGALFFIFENTLLNSLNIGSAVTSLCTFESNGAQRVVCGDASGAVSCFNLFERCWKTTLPNTLNQSKSRDISVRGLTMISVPEYKYIAAIHCEKNDTDGLYFLSFEGELIRMVSFPARILSICTLEHSKRNTIMFASCSDGMIYAIDSLFNHKPYCSLDFQVTEMLSFTSLLQNEVILCSGYFNGLIVISDGKIVGSLPDSDRFVSIAKNTFKPDEDKAENKIITVCTTEALKLYKIIVRC